MIDLFGADDRRTAWVIAGLALLATLPYVALSMHLPVALYADFGHDDAYFVQLARAMASGDWLGQYDRYTLMKGPGYPLFLAVNHALGLPVTLSHALFHAAACGLLAQALARLSASRWLGLAAFVAMLWNPAALSWTRVVRDDIAAGQAMLVLAGVLHLLFIARSRRARVAWAAFSGAAFAWFWLTREDGIWLVPGIALLFLARGLQSRGDRRALRDVALATVAFVLCAWLPWAALGLANAAKYGRFETVDFRSGEFQDALAALHRVRVGEAVPYVPVPEAVRDAVAAVSPTFAAMQPYFRGRGQGWVRAANCTRMPTTCGDFPGALFVWALRDAVASTSGYASPDAAADTYRRIADDIDAACDDGRLACVRASYGFLPPTSAAQWRSAPARIANAASVLLWQQAPAASLASRGGETRIKAMWQFLGLPRIAPSRGEDDLLLAGWLRHEDEDAWLQVRCASDRGAVVPVRRRPSRDLVAHFDDETLDDNRFEIRLPADDACALELSRGGEARAVALPTAGSPRPVEIERGILHFDTVVHDFACCDAAPRAQAVRRIVGEGYAAVSPWLAIAGVLAFAWAAARMAWRRRFDVLAVVAAAAWAMVACRVALVVIVDLSSFSAVNVQYLQPAFPLLVFAAIASLSAAWRGMRTGAAMAGGARPDPATP